jgi:hypothetical protein
MPTASELSTTLAKYTAARDAILDGSVSNVQVEGQSYTFHNLTDLEKMIDRYQNRLAIANQTVVTGLGVRGRLGGMGY